MRVFGYLVIFLDSWVTLIDAETAFRWQRLFIRNVRYNKRSFSAIFSFYFLFSLTSFELFELLFPVRKRRRKEMISWPFEFRLWSFTEDDVHLDSLWRKGHGRGCFMFSFFFFFFLEGRLICQTQEQVFWKRYHWINHSFRNRYEHSSFRKLQFLTQPDSQHRKNQKGKKRTKRNGNRVATQVSLINHLSQCSYLPAIYYLSGVALGPVEADDWRRLRDRWQSRTVSRSGREYGRPGLLGLRRWFGVPRQ